MTRPAGERPTLRARGVPTLAVFLGALACLLLLPPTEKPRQPDETAWIAVGAESFALLAAGDVSREAWDDPRWGPFGYGYPVLGKLLIGGSIALHGRGEEARSLLPGGVFDWETVRDTRPSPALLRAGRAPLLVLGALAGVLLFLLVRELCGSAGLGLLAAGLFVVRPLVLESGRQAMVDMPALTLGLLALVAAARAGAEERTGARSRTGLIGVAGLACGLAAAAKLSGSLTLFVVLAWLAMGGGRRAFLRTALLLVAAAALAFVVVQPPAWSGPLEHLSAVIEHARRVELYDVPAERRLVDWPARAAAIARAGLAVSDPLDAWLGWRVVGAALAAVGALGTLRSWRKPWARALGLWFGLGTLALFLSVPFDWRRWYLPLEPCWAFLQALGVWTLARGVTDLSRIHARAGRT